MTFQKLSGKKFALTISAIIFFARLSAQQKEFEGILYYTTEVKSKAPDIPDRDMTIMLGITNNSKVYIKEGNTKRSNNLMDQYYISSKEKIYMKFRGIDTLYYTDYDSDTTRVFNVSKSDEHKIIAGFECKTLTLETSSGTSRYLYAPLLHRSPEYEKNNLVASLNVFSKETESIWLAVVTEAKYYHLSESCNRVEQKPIDNSVFDLPALPQKEFSIDALSKPAEFKRGGGWEKYLQASLNAEVASKYLKIPKGETEASQTVQLSFVISETGEVVNVKVLNRKEVRSGLAEEAVRVLTESYGWKPATMYGQKISSRMEQGITFQVSK